MPRMMSATEVANQIKDKMTVMVGGFGRWGYANELLRALNQETETKDLTFIFNSVFAAEHVDLEQMLETRTAQVLCSFVRNSPMCAKLFYEGKLTLVPQGNLAERIRLGGYGVPAYYSPVGVGTPFAEGKEVRTFHDRDYVLETTLQGDVALIRATQVDSMGNCFLKGVTKNFSPLMASACKQVFVETSNYIDGYLDPELVTIPGILVDGIVNVG